MIRRKMISINVSGEAILRNTYGLEFRIYQKKRVQKNLTFGQKVAFLHLASNAKITRLLTLRTR